MPAFNAAKSVLCLGLLALLGACSAPAERDASDESDIRKRINPNSGTAAFEVDKPTWYTDAFVSGFRFDNAAIPFGTPVERAAGTFGFSSGIVYQPSYYGPISFNYDSESMTVPLTLGTISVFTPAGFVIRYSRAVNAGQSRVLGTRKNASGVAQNVIGFFSNELRTAASSFLMFDGHYTLETSADTLQTFDIAEGEKKEFVLPTATVDLAFETIDAAYPGTATCLGLTHVATNNHVGQASENLPVVRGASYVVPAGAFASIQVSACGELKSLPATADAAIAITVHRLEVNDLDVVDPNGVHRTVHGTFTVDRKKVDGTYVAVLGAAQTHVGVDLTDGTYRVTSSAPNVADNVQEVTFP